MLQKPGLSSTAEVDPWRHLAAAILLQAVKDALRGGMPSGNLVFCFNPMDWETLELYRETTGGFVLKDATQPLPIDRARRRLWGVPVALSTQQPQATGLLFDRRAVQLYERQGVDLSWSESVYDADARATDFERNLIRWRSEGRWAFAIYRPAAIVEIALEEGS